MDALKQHFDENIKQWLKNPHIKAAHTGHVIEDEEAYNRQLHDLHNEKDPSRLHLYATSPEELAQRPRAIFLYVDDPNDDSVGQLKKAIEAAGHRVFVHHQPEDLEYQTNLNYGEEIWKSATAYGSIGATVKDKSNKHYILSCGHGFPVGTKFYVDATLKTHVGTVTEQKHGGNLDSSIALLEGSVALCPSIHPVQSKKVNSTAVDVKVGDIAIFHGAKSGSHAGKVSAIDWSGKIAGEDFHGMIQVRQAVISQPGDSGAGYFHLDTAKSEYNFCGLHATGNKVTAGIYTIAAPAKPNLAALGLNDDCLVFK